MPNRPNLPSAALGALVAASTLCTMAIPRSAAAQIRSPGPLEVGEGTEGEIGSALDRYVARFVPFGFSGQVLAAVDGRIVLHRAYGLASRVDRRPMLAETAVGIASATKQFTAAALLKLAQEGRLSLRDPLERWLDGVPEGKQGITIEQLLTHTAGVGVGLAEDFEATSLQEQVKAILDAPLSGEPGSGWRYSNGGYILAAAIVGRASGTTYERYLRSALFEPAGMVHTGFVHAPPEDTPVARAYSGWQDNGAPGEWPRNWRAFGSGDVISTAADLWRWERALREGRILSEEWLGRYLAPRVEIGESAAYGYGLFVHEGDGGTVVEHGGDTRSGYNAGFFRYLDRDAVLIVTSNSQLSPGRWMRHTFSAGLERIVLGGDVDDAPPAARLPTAGEAQRLAGSYSIGAGDELHIVYDGSYLWVAAEGQRAAELVFGGDHGGHALVEADRKTRALLEALLRGGPREPEAYSRALGEEGRPYLDDYVGEWMRLESVLGPYERFEVLGSLPARGDVGTTTRLRFRDGSVGMTWWWSERGRGRLRGTRVSADAAFPVFVPAAQGPDGSLVVHDPWRETTLLAVPTDGTSGPLLRFRNGPAAVRRGIVAWTP